MAGEEVAAIPVVITVAEAVGMEGTEVRGARWICGQLKEKISNSIHPDYKWQRILFLKPEDILPKSFASMILISKAAQEIVEVSGLENDKFKSVWAQLSKVCEHMKKYRKSLDSLKGE